jgi:integrase
VGTVLARPRHTGIVVKHRAGCASAIGGRCNCRRVYQASVWSARDQRRIRKHFDTLAAARAWRADSYGRLRRREWRAPTPMTLARASELWLIGARAGAIHTRSGDPYKPSTLRSYDLALHGGGTGAGGLLAELGHLRLAEVTPDHVQDYADRLLSAGAKPSTIRNAVMPLRAIYRWHAREIPINPTGGLRLPAVRLRRDRIVSPYEARRLLWALPASDRALWATALYAGLRRGELMALRWSDIALAEGVIRVERAWDPKERQMVAPKSAAGRRRVPIASLLRSYLVSPNLAAPVELERLAFGVGTVPFSASTNTERAHRAWRRAGLEPVSLHDCRHTFASLMIAAGVNAKALSVFMGHANISITLDRYGHLMPGAEGESADLLDAYLQSSPPVTVR